jgi:hypothetical protein
MEKTQAARTTEKRTSFTVAPANPLNTVRARLISPLAVDRRSQFRLRT